ncbi:MAG: chromosome segregation protein SMC, partial [Clostridia bacterium]|nr:chromosome segregation protein SMC [Clostridia bacterium]
KDIHELFMDTGLGRDGYSMIGQGNVAQILSTKAEDRRAFFEEAAGVSKYKHRKDEAVRKLMSVDENLVRIDDITTELERQLGPLENQSKKARKYLVLYEEYKGLDVSMSLINLQKNSELIKKATELYKSISDEMQDLKSKETEIESQRNELYLKSSKKDEEQSQKNNELIENEARLMSVSNEISIAENDIKNNETLSTRIDNEIKDIEEKNSLLKTRIDEIMSSIEAYEIEKKDLMMSFETIQQANVEIYEGLTSCRKLIDEMKEELILKMEQLSIEKAKVSGIENRRLSIIERKEILENELNNFGLGVENTKKEIEETTELIAEKTQKAEVMKIRVNTQEEKISSLKEEITTLEKDISQIQVSLNSKSSQKRILESMENEYEGFSKSVKTVMTAPELKKAVIFGTVSGLINVEKKYVTAIEIALGNSMQNIVVQSEEDAQIAIEFLKSTKGGRATFLPLSSASAKDMDNVNEISKCSGYLGIASNLIKYDKKYDVVMKSLLGRVIVADTLDNAISIAKKFKYRFKIVTLDGEFLNTGGSISGGSVNKTSGFLSRAVKIKELGKEISDLTNNLKDLTAKSDKLNQDVNNSKIQLDTYAPLLREYENEILLAKNNLEHLNSTLSNSGSSQLSLKDELERIEKELSSSTDEVAIQINSTRCVERAINELNEKISVNEEEYNKISAQKDLKSQQLMDETMRLRAIEQDIENKKEAYESLLSTIDENKKILLKKSEDKQEIVKLNEDLSAKIEAKKLEIEDIKNISSAIKSQIELIEKEKQNIVDGLKDITNDNKDLTDKLINLQQELSRAEAKQIKYENDSESIIIRLWDEYELTQTDAEQIANPVENYDETKQRVLELKNKIKALGSVNLDSIEEYTNSKERYDFLTEQKADLEKSKDNLNKVISSMQELMEEHFQKQFVEINKAFARVFNELFGGGKGRLYLSDPDDVMESGIEIEVQLPGKGLQNINLYSGGEKSFIAIALLFAILEVKPTPFCFLDEIDAALDDVNVSRFATYLKNYLNSTQFIVITHRRGTMESSNIMYGVTMQEKGVSKLLSLHIDDVDDDMLK